LTNTIHKNTRRHWTALRIFTKQFLIETWWRKPR